MQKIRSLNYLLVKSLLILLLATFSCKKSELNQISYSTDTEIEKKFFQIPADTDPAVIAVVAQIKAQNEQLSFVDQYVGYAGYPIWNKAKMSKRNINERSSVIDTNSTQVIYIPFSQPNRNFIGAVLEVWIRGSDTLFNTIYYKQYQQYGYHARTGYKWDANKVFNLFASFQHEVYGTTRFTVKDKNLFNFQRDTIVQLKLQSSQSTPISRTIAIEECATFTWCVPYLLARETSHSDPNCYMEGQLEICTVYYYEVDGGGGNIGGDDPTSGEDTDPWGNPCRPINGLDPCASDEEDDNFGWEAEPLVIIDYINFVRTRLNLNQVKVDWLQANPDRAIEMYNYLATTQQIRTTAEIVANEHLDGMINNNEYLTFVQGHATSTNTLVAWWEDIPWISNTNNFNLGYDIGQQDPELTLAERALIAMYPYNAAILNKNWPKAFQLANVYMGVTGAENDGLNDKKDAFRHAFFNAINTRDCLPSLAPTPTTASEIVRRFGIAHESEVPQQLQLEKTMDLFNNGIGISYCWNCYTTTDLSIATAIFDKLNNGDLRYLKPFLSPAQDPNFWGNNGFGYSNTGTHGLILTGPGQTQVVPTNQ